VSIRSNTVYYRVCNYPGCEATSQVTASISESRPDTWAQGGEIDGCPHV